MNGFPFHLPQTCFSPGEPDAARDGCSDWSFDRERRSQRGGRHGQAGERGRDIGLVVP